MFRELRIAGWVRTRSPQVQGRGGGLRIDARSFGGSPGTSGRRQRAGKKLRGGWKFVANFFCFVFPVDLGLLQTWMDGWGAPSFQFIWGPWFFWRWWKICVFVVLCCVVLHFQEWQPLRL